MQMFHEKLKKAMVDLEITQSQLCQMTGIGKSSISQYLSCKNVPSEARQTEIAKSLGLADDYFKQEKIKLSVSATNGGIPKMDVKDVAKLLHMNHDTVRKGLKQGVFPWGYAIHTSEHRWVYFINAKKFAETEGVAKK